MAFDTVDVLAIPPFAAKRCLQLGKAREQLRQAEGVVLQVLLVLAVNGVDLPLRCWNSLKNPMPSRSSTLAKDPDGFCEKRQIGNGRNTVSRVLFQRRELTEFYGKLSEFCEKLGEFALAHK